MLLLFDFIDVIPRIVVRYTCSPSFASISLNKSQFLVVSTLNVQVGIYMVGTIYGLCLCIVLCISPL